MTPDQSRAFLEWSDRQYADEHVRAGTWDASDALARAKEETSMLLPRGPDTPDHFFRSVEQDSPGERLGEVWYALQRAGQRTQAVVYWIGVHPRYRRQGVATRVLRQVEEEARKAGATRLLLSVFGDNSAALALYAKLGVHVASATMVKPIGPGR